MLIGLGAMIRLCRGLRSPERGTWWRLVDDRRKKWAEFRRMYKYKPSNEKKGHIQEARVDSMSKGVVKQVAGHE